MTKLLLFDLDGTLVNTDFIYIKVWNELLKFYISTYFTPYTYHSSPNDYRKDEDKIKYNTNTENTPYYPHTNVNESDLIYYILGNH